MIDDELGVQRKISYLEIDYADMDILLWNFADVARKLYDELCECRVKGQDVRLIFRAYLESEE